MEKRQVLRWMIMFLYACNTLITININVAIISMTRPFENIEEDAQTVKKAAICPNITFSWSNVDEKKTIILNQEDTYNWSNYEKRMVSSAYHWLSYFSILPASVMAQKYGSKVVVGYAFCISAVMSSIIPFAATFGADAVMYVRMVQGLFSFIAVPGGILTVVGNWSSKGDRGRFISMFLVGVTLGSSLGSYVFGYIGQYLHWKYIFHLTSIAGVVFTVFWYFLIFDHPEQHPTIPVPWKDIFTSIPVIACFPTYSLCMFNSFVIMAYMPLYMLDMYGINSKQAGILMSLPELLCGLSVLGLAWFIDYFVKKQWLSLTHTRKLFLLTSAFLASVPLIAMAFIIGNCNFQMAVILYFIFVVSRCLDLFAGPSVVVDMSPKFCGILEGKMGTSAEIVIFAFSTGINYLSKILAGEKFWKVLFLFTASVNLLAAIIFTVWGSAEVQPWNEGSRKYRNKNHRANKRSLKLLNIDGSQF